MNIFVWKLSKIAARKKVFFFFTFIPFEVPFNGLFVPTSRSRMSNIFRDSEFLGKSNGKKWSQLWTFLFENCLKSPRKKKFFFPHFFTFEVPFNGLFAPTSRNRMSNIFRDSESLRKSNGKKWSNIWTFLFGSGLKSHHKKKFFFAEFDLVHPPMASVLLSASVERCFVSHMRDFFKLVTNYTSFYRAFYGLLPALKIWIACKTKKLCFCVELLPPYLQCMACTPLMHNSLVHFVMT